MRLKPLLLTIWLISFPALAQGPVPGDMAPDFTLPSNGQYNQRLSEQKGQVVILVFWTTWCGSCSDLLSNLEQVQQQYKDFGVKIWTLGLGEEQEKLQRHHRSLESPLTLLFDPLFEIAKTYDISDLPAIAVIDRDGKVGYRSDGYPTDELLKLDQYLKTLVSK